MKLFFWHFILCLSVPGAASFMFDKASTSYSMSLPANFGAKFQAGNFANLIFINEYFTYWHNFVRQNYIRVMRVCINSYKFRINRKTRLKIFIHFGSSGKVTKEKAQSGGNWKLLGFLHKIDWHIEQFSISFIKNKFFHMFFLFKLTFICQKSIILKQIVSFFYYPIIDFLDDF